MSWQFSRHGVALQQQQPDKSGKSEGDNQPAKKMPGRTMRRRMHKDDIMVLKICSFMSFENPAVKYS
jgi:hypothetical protein